MTSDFPDRRVRVVLLMRKSLPGQRSIERVFRGVEKALPDDIDCRTVSLPFESRGVLPRIANMVYAGLLRGDVVHVTGDIYYCGILVRRKRNLITILDLTSVRRLGGWRRALLAMVWYRLPVHRARRVTAISDSTLHELRGLIPAAMEKSSTVACPISAEFREAGSRPRPARSVPTVLQVGTSSNKNLERTARALSGLPVHLRIVGRLTNDQRQLLNELDLEFSAIANVSDTQLVDEYAGSDVLVFASLYEGFGLPIVEAQAVGLPVITSDHSSMPEVMGDGGLLVDPTDESDIRRAVVRILDDPALRDQLRRCGELNAQRFTPEDIAEQYAAIYRSFRS